MLLRPSNTLLLDEPTNHLDLDSKEVLLDALAAYGGTLMFVSHDRYFVERLATKIVEVGHGTAVVYPGTYTEFLWHKEHPHDTQAGRAGEGAPVGTHQKDVGRSTPSAPERHLRKIRATHQERSASETPSPQPSREDRKRADAEARRHQRADQARRSEIDRLEARIAETERSIREIEDTMTAPGFYEDRAAAQPIINRHQALMWKVGDLMHQWEELQKAANLVATDSSVTKS
jgi:ATP-binding cassette subfamily F protein 3